MPCAVAATFVFIFSHDWCKQLLEKQLEITSGGLDEVRAAGVGIWPIGLHDSGRWCFACVSCVCLNKGNTRPGDVMQGSREPPLFRQPVKYRHNVHDSQGVGMALWTETDWCNTSC